MRVLLTGATGLIGSAVLARLLSDGHEVVAVARRPAALRTRRVVLNLAQATSPGAWLPHLSGVDAVINCAGVLQDSPREDTSKVHHLGVDALFRACELAGVRRVIHFSAIGIAAVARIVVIADFMFTATAVVAQPVTGVALAYVVGYPLKEGWIVLSIALYILTGLFWLPVVLMQMELRRLSEAAALAGKPLPPRYHRLFWLWFAFGFPAFGAVAAIFWLMITRPELPWLETGPPLTSMQ